MVRNGNLRLFHLTLNFLYFKQTMQTLNKRRVLWRLIWVCTVCHYPSHGFTDNPLYTALRRHSDKNSSAVNNRYLDFVQTRGWISLVNDNHVDNNLKEMLAFVYYGSIVNNRPKKTGAQETCASLTRLGSPRSACAFAQGCSGRHCSHITIKLYWNLYSVFHVVWSEPALFTLGSFKVLYEGHWWGPLRENAYSNILNNLPQKLKIFR